MTGLQGQELVAHVFVDVRGQAAVGDQAWLLDLWRRCAHDVAPHDPGPVPDLGLAPAPGGVLAVRSGSGPGLRQVLLRRLDDVLVLSWLRAPAPGNPDGWPALEQAWAALGQPPTSGVLGTVRILQARLADPAESLDPGVAGPVVAVAAATPGAWSTAGVLRSAEPYGPFMVWEAPERPDPAAPARGDDAAEADARADRRIVVVAAADRDAALSAWTWSRGAPELTPFARYLLQVAKIRYELRVRRATAGRDLRGTVDAEIAPLLRLTAAVGDTGRAPDVRALTAAAARLIRLQAGEMGLVDTASRLREMHRTVDIATRNMTAHAGPEKATGLFADDAALAAWAGRQIDNDATYLEAALERARSVTTLADQLVQRGLQDRRQRFELALTGVIGAILMVLGAMQSLKLEFALQKALLGAVVTVLGAAALLVPLLLLRLAVPDRGWSAVPVCLAVGLLTGTVPWLGLAIEAEIHKAPLPVAAVLGGGLAAGVIGAVSTAVWFLARRRA